MRQHTSPCRLRPPPSWPCRAGRVGMAMPSDRHGHAERPTRCGGPPCAPPNRTRRQRQRASRRWRSGRNLTITEKTKLGSLPLRYYVSFSRGGARRMFCPWGVLNIDAIIQTDFFDGRARADRGASRAFFDLECRAAAARRGARRGLSCCGASRRHRPSEGAEEHVIFCSSSSGEASA